MKDSNCAYIDRVVDDVIKSIGDPNVERFNETRSRELGGYSVLLRVHGKPDPIPIVIPSLYLDPSMRGEPLRHFIDREVQRALRQPPPYSSGK